MNASKWAVSPSHGRHVTLRPIESPRRRPPDASRLPCKRFKGTINLLGSFRVGNPGSLRYLVRGWPLRPLSHRFRNILYRWLVHSPLRRVVAPVYLLILEAEIAFFKAIEPFLLKQKTSQLENVTAVIKTFERPRRCRELIKSIRRQYPKLPIIVVDDGINQEDYAGVTNVKMSFDSGVSAGRSAGLDMVKTDYFINLDDDRLFYHRTNICRAIAIMEEYREIDLMGGSVLDLPLFIRHEYKNKSLFPTHRKSVIEAGEKLGGLEVYEKVPNFFIARTDRVRLVGWDEKLKRVDHADFFTRAKGTLVSVFNPDLEVLHIKNPFDTEYNKYRNDIEADLLYLGQKHSSR